MRAQMFTVQEPEGLLTFLLAQLRGMSRNNVKSLLTRGQIRVDGVRVTRHDFALKSGQRVEVLPFATEDIKPPFPIVYEDDGLLVTSKPAGLLTISTDKEKERTAYYMLTAYVKNSHPDNRIFVVHRLDRETSGLLVFAKTERLKLALQDDWAELATRRGYLALVEGTVEPPDGTVRSWLKQTTSLVVYSGSKSGGGQEAVTHYRTLKANAMYSLLDVSLETGRKNQIRVHMKDLGHPVVGDEKYGALSNPLNRLGLHANRLTLRHPLTGETLEFQSAAPKSFMSAVSKK